MCSEVGVLLWHRWDNGCNGKCEMIASNHATFYRIEWPFTDATHLDRQTDGQMDYGDKNRTNGPILRQSSESGEKVND